MKLDTRLVHKIIRSNPNLNNMYRWYLSHCLSLNVPYHNMRHTLGMMYHIIVLYNNSRRVDSDYGFSLNDEDLYILLVSALFHDFNHSAGRFDDATNVSTSISGLRDCMESCLVWDETTEEYYKKCSDNIKATQYPYVISDDNLTVHQRILRECDILVILYDDCITQNIMGLAAEMHQTHLEEFFVKYLDFIFNAVKNFKLAYSLDTWKEHSDTLLKELDEFAKIFKD